MSLQPAATTQQVNLATADMIDAQENLLRLGLTAEQQQERDTHDATTNPQIDAEGAQVSPSPVVQQDTTPLEPAPIQLEQHVPRSHIASGASVIDTRDSVPFTKEESPIFSQAQLAQLAFFRSEAAVTEPAPPAPTSPVVAAFQSNMAAESKPVLQTNLNGNLAWVDQFAEEVVNSSLQGPARISAYAKLEFPDGEFYMNTHSIILGRDLQATRAAMREAAQREVEEDGNLPAPTTPALANPEERRYKKSIASETGGILLGNAAAEPEERPRRSRKASKKSKSTGSSSRHPSRRNSLAQPNGATQPTLRAELIGSVTAGAAPVDPASLRPSPLDCPILGIHPPAPSDLSGHKTISRRHLMIAYNSKKRLFEAHILGRNGAFVGEDFCPHDKIVPLKSGTKLQIGGIVVKFVLPDVAIGRTGAEEEYEEESPRAKYREGGKEMSFDFEESPRHGVLDGTSDEESVTGVQENSSTDDGDEDEINEDDEDNESANSETMDADDGVVEAGFRDGESLRQQLELERKIAADLLSQKKRGPGRPPKNGIMSKREQQLVKKAAAEAQARAQAQAQTPSQEKAEATEPQEPITKKKVGRPRKHPVPDPSIKVQKRKYTKRKPKDPDAVQAGGSGNDTKDKKQKKPKRPRSPTPELHRDDFTPEQLERPKQGYVQILHDILTNAKGAALPLSKIYRAMMLKYPYFYFDAGTNGWQSSVRHNLTQNAAFDKVRVEGEGMWWTVVPGVSIEKEKKHKLASPSEGLSGQTHHQVIYQAPHMLHGQAYDPAMMPPPGYQLAPNMYPQYRPGLYIPPTQQAGAPQYPLGNLMPPNGYSPHFVTPMHAPLLAQPSPVAYNSPYATKPPQQQQQQQQQPSSENGQQPPVGQQPFLVGQPLTGQQFLSGQPPPPPPPGQQLTPGLQPPNQGLAPATAPTPMRTPPSDPAYHSLLQTHARVK